MSNIKQLQRLVDDGESLKMITQGYAEISASKLQTIRGSMEHNISFARELGQIFHTLKEEGLKHGLKLAPKIPGVAQLLISSNNRFYGALEKPLARYFATSTASFASQHPQIPTFKLVIGRTGATFLTALKYPSPYTPITLASDLPSAEELKRLMQSVSQYQTILVYHSRFQTVLTQLPIVSEVTQTLVEPKEGGTPVQYIFEPELQQILEFFESQILQILLEQTFLESELARTASRLTSMDAAENNANDYLKIQKRVLGTAKRSEASSKALEMVNALLAVKR